MSDNAQVLLIESKKASAPSFAPALEKRGYTLDIVHTTPAALKAANQNKPDIIILDAASLRTSGARMTRNLRQNLNGSRILLIVEEGVRTATNTDADLILKHPFTIRKLVNGIIQLLPAAEGTWIETGPIRLNVDQRRVISDKNEATLTPKKARLLEILMRHAGQVVTRKYLIKKVWYTDYTGDTRTLDVHISWLRNVLEPNSKHSNYIKTIRGQGYMLDVELTPAQAKAIRKLSKKDGDRKDQS